MRIAFHVPRATYLKPGPSGDKVFVQSLLNGLRRRGHDVEIVSRLKTRNVWRGKLDLSELFFEVAAAGKRMKRFAPDACLVYGASYSHPDFICLWQRPERYVLLAADLDAKDRIPDDLRPLFVFNHHESLRRADKVAAYHPHGLDRLTKFGVPPERLSLLSPAPDGWQDIPTKEEARNSLGLPKTAPILLCAARLPEPRSDEGASKAEMILNLLRHVVSLPSETVIVIAGDGPGRKYLEGEAARIGPATQLRFAGAVPHDEMSRYFAACDFFVYPNSIDRPWLAVLEAQSCGTPVVTMDTRSAQLTVVDGSTGLLAQDQDEFNSHITFLASDRPRCTAMGQAARDYVTGHHTVDIRLDQLEQLLALPRAAPPS